VAQQDKRIDALSFLLVLGNVRPEAILMNSCLKYILLILLTAGLGGIPFSVFGQVQDAQSQAQSPPHASNSAGAQTPASPTLAEIDRQLNNPLTSIWSLTFQENFSLNKGDLVDGTELGNTFFFQPALPIPLGNDMVFIARPVFPLVTNTVLDPTSEDRVNGKKTGFGDIQILAAFGPNRRDGVVWGLGPTLKFPTASNRVLGQEKYQAGPAGMLFHIGKPWILGGLVQHWWSYAGDNDRDHISQTDIQYVIRRSFPGAMSIGMGPTVVVDWEADSGNKLTLPIGLGITKTVRWGKMPIKLRFEPQYSIIRPDDFGTAWNFRLQITPVIPSPFK
jgi:hypothetical protein